MKKTFIISFIISGTALVFWPLMAFLSIFIWDAPIKSSTDELYRNLLMLWMIGYPAVWAICLGIGGLALYKSWKKTTIVSIVIPYLYILSKAIPVLWAGIPMLFAGKSN